MAKHHKIPASEIARIPVYLTPMAPRRGEFARYTTQCPVDLWNNKTLAMVARHSFCPDARAMAQSELNKRKESRE